MPPVFRRVLPGASASAPGDGMSAVAIAWLALKLAPAGRRGLWVGAAVAAYTLPGAVGAIALRRWLSGRHGAGLAAPVGTALGGPLVSAAGARGTLLVSALATIALGLITTAVLARFRTGRPSPASHHPSEPTAIDN